MTLPVIEAEMIYDYWFGNRLVRNVSAVSVCLKGIPVKDHRRTEIKTPERYLQPPGEGLMLVQQWPFNSAG